jgi:hypothetical protein
LVAAVLPDDQPFDQIVQPLALLLLGLLGGKAVRMRGGVVDELGEEDGAGHGQLPAGPPVVQPPRVVLALRAVALSLPVDYLQGQRNLDQLALGRMIWLAVAVAHRRCLFVPRLDTVR